MYVVLTTKKFESAGQLFEEMTNDDLVKTRVGRGGILPSHVMGRSMGDELVSLLDE